MTATHIITDYTLTKHQTRTVMRLTVDSTNPPGVFNAGDRLVFNDPRGWATEVEVTDVRTETLADIYDEPDGPAAEGFPEMSAADFCELWQLSHGYKLTDCTCCIPVRRIEWRYLDEVAS